MKCGRLRLVKTSVNVILVVGRLVQTVASLALLVVVLRNRLTSDTVNFPGMRYRHTACS